MIVTGTERVLGSHREAIDVRAVEAGNVHGGDDVPGQDAIERLRQGHILCRQRPQVQHGVEAALGFVAVEHVEELILLHVFA